jgi:hypothetical protein
MTVQIAFPYHLGPLGRTATVSDADHVSQMLEQLLFTRPGERVNRPDFGCGLMDLVFGPNSPELAAAVSHTISAAVQKWLADVVDVTAVQVTAQDSTLRIGLSYLMRATGEAGSEAWSVPGAA